MITSTHDQLEAWVAGLTIISMAWGGYSAFKSYTNRGWQVARKLKEEQLNRAIMDLIESKQTQFRRIDELQRDVDNCVKRDVHDQLQKEISLRFETVTANLSQQIREGFTQVNLRIDRLADKRAS